MRSSGSPVVSATYGNLTARFVPAPHDREPQRVQAATAQGGAIVVGPRSCLPGGCRREETRVNDQLWQAIIDLPPRQRAAIVLRFYEDLERGAGCRHPPLFGQGPEPARGASDEDPSAPRVDPS